MLLSRSNDRPVSFKHSEGVHSLQVAVNQILQAILLISPIHMQHSAKHACVLNGEMAISRWHRQKVTGIPNGSRYFMYLQTNDLSNGKTIFSSCVTRPHFISCIIFFLFGSSCLALFARFILQSRVMFLFSQLILVIVQPRYRQINVGFKSQLYILGGRPQEQPKKVSTSSKFLAEFVTLLLGFVHVRCSSRK